MEIPAWLFFSFASLISIIFLHLGFFTLDKTGLSNSVSPLVMSFFKHSLAISSCSSSGYALVFHPQTKLHIDRRYIWVPLGVVPSLFYAGVMNLSFVWGPLLLLLLWFLAWCIHFLPELKIFADRYAVIISIMLISSSLFPWWFLISVLINFHLIHFGDNNLICKEKIRISIHMAVESSLFLVSSRNTSFYPIMVLFISFLISASWAAISGYEPLTTVSWDSLSEVENSRNSFQKLLPVAAKGQEIFSNLKGGKLIGFAVGIGASALFQYFFRLTSFDHVLAFLYLAVAWVVNMSLLGVSGDLGVCNFVLGNVIVGCTVSQFGLRSTTWLAYGASLLLFALRLKLQSVTLVYRQVGQVQVALN